MTAPQNPADVALVRLSEEYRSLHAEYERLSAAEDETTGAERIAVTEKANMAGARMQEIEAAMSGLVATTLVGDQANATVGLLRYGNGPHGLLDQEHALIWSMMQAIVNRAA